MKKLSERGARPIPKAARAEPRLLSTSYPTHYHLWVMVSSLVRASTPKHLSPHPFKIHSNKLRLKKTFINTTQVSLVRLFDYLIVRQRR